MDTIDMLYEKSKLCREYEPVPGDFWIKKTMMDIFLHFVDLGHARKGLEIGCGSGISSVYLSRYCDHLTTTDLPEYDAKTHSIGLSVAKGLISKMEIPNVDFLACAAGTLPFPDSTFDFVYAASVLEHVKDKEAALKEMVRVARPGGRVILFVPTHIQSLCLFIHLPLYVTKRIFEVASTKLFKNRIKKKTLLPVSDDSRPIKAIVDDFFKNHPSFPLPMPHGDYKDIFEEMRRQFPHKWKAMANRHGKVTDFAFLFLPFGIIEIFSTRFLAWLYDKTRVLHYIFGASFLKYLAYGYCVVIEKETVRQ